MISWFLKSLVWNSHEFGKETAIFVQDSYFYVLPGGYR